MKKSKVKVEDRMKRVVLEAATELPAYMGFPEHVLKTLPSGFDGVEPAKPVSEEKKKKLKDSYLSMRGRLEQIADLALAATAKCGTCDKIGENWVTCSKAIGEIRRICKQSFAEEIVPDYEWLAKIVTSDHFEPECLAKAIEAEASKRPFYYTPGWLCELAKKLQGDGTVSPPLSAVGADKSAKTAEYMRRKYSFCDGLFPIHRANSEKNVVEHCWIGGRRFTMELGQDIHDDGEHVCCAKIRDNGKLIARLTVYRGKSMAEHVSHAAFKAYVKNLGGSNRLSSRGGFLKQAIKRKAAAKGQQAHDSKVTDAKEVK